LFLSKYFDIPGRGAPGIEVPATFTLRGLKENSSRVKDKKKLKGGGNVLSK
jgi:hypothetical protein